MTQFYGKTKICYGGRALATLERLPARRAFIVTDKVMVKSGFTDRVKSHLDRAGIGHTTFDEVGPDPSLEMVTNGAAHFMRDKTDLIVALGGGSVIDAAKGIMYFAWKALGEGEKPLLVAIPTTSGTGSEVTSFAVITDTANEVKIPLNDEALIPDIAILDSRFTRTVPPGGTAATGMDVLTHAIEAYTSVRANEFTSIYARNAIRYVFRYLKRAYDFGDDMEAREKMLLASCMAGMAFNNSGLGLAHSLAHSLGGLFHVPHGLANAVLLPYVIRFNSFHAGMLYREIAEVAGLPAHSVEEGVNNLVSGIQQLNASMNIPENVRALKVDEKIYREHGHVMVQNVLNDICTQGNPRQPSEADILQLLELVW